MVVDETLTPAFPNRQMEADRDRGQHGERVPPKGQRSQGQQDRIHIQREHDAQDRPLTTENLEPFGRTSLSPDGL